MIMIHYDYFFFIFLIFIFILLCVVVGFLVSVSGPVFRAAPRGVVK